MTRRCALLAACASLALADCGRPPPAPGEEVVATIDGDPVTRAELDRYVALQVVELDGEFEVPATEQAEVRSRLLDALIDERLLLAEAARRGIEVADVEVDASLAADGGRPDDAEQYLHVRRRMILERLQEELLRALPPIDADEIRAYQRSAGDDRATSKRLRLRALILPSAEEAARVSRDVRAGRMTFDEAVARFRTEPGHGLPLPVEWDALAREVRDALRDLEPGKVSRPVLLDGTAHLFQIQSWKVEPEDGGAGARAEALRELRERRRRGTLEGLLAELRGTASIHIRRRRLPFRYVAPAAAGE